MKVTAAAFVVLALVIGVAPLFLDCQSQGRSIALANGMQVPMKCHWSAIAEAGMAAPIAGIGLAGGFSKRKETRRVLAGLGVLLGALVILLPTQLIGVCASSDMLCNSVMRPLLILSGILVMGVSAWQFLAFGRGADQQAA